MREDLTTLAPGMAIVTVFEVDYAHAKLGADH